MLGAAGASVAAPPLPVGSEPPAAPGATVTQASPGGGETLAPIVNGTGSGGTGGSNTTTNSNSGTAGSGAAGSGAVASLEWLPTWATTIQSTEPNNLPPALPNTTLRQFVWPTLSGQDIRIQLSNEKGTAPVEIQKVHIARALTEGTAGNSNGQIDTATDAGFTFNGAASVTIPAGQTVWSDALTYPLAEIQLTAITMQFGNGVPTEITGHPGARETSYVAAGDLVSQQALAGAQTRDRWYFINAIEVMAPSDAFAIAALGDSITDGYGVLNQFARWTDFLTLALQQDPALANNRSVLNFGMGANALTSSSQYQDAGVLRFERDVLTRDKVKWLIVLEGINDIRANVQAQPLIDAYRQIIQKSHEKGILVYGATVTPNGPSAVRSAVNDWIRTSGEFDQVIDFDTLLRNPGDVNNLLPTFNNDNLHPSLAGYEAMGKAVLPSLFYAAAAAK
jgi:lysophospholipase L1-like esterase